MRLFFQPPTTTRMTSSVVVKQVVLFTILLFYPRIYEEWCFTFYGETRVTEPKRMIVVQSRLSVSPLLCNRSSVTAIISGVTSLECTTHTRTPYWCT